MRPTCYKCYRFKECCDSLCGRAFRCVDFLPSDGLVNREQYDVEDLEWLNEQEEKDYVRA